jgi:Ca2+-binding EF-hand superfamily protein
MCDGNEDGKLSLRELTKSVQNNKDIAIMLRIPDNHSGDYKAYIESVFMDMETDHSGGVSEKEFISYFTAHD